MESKQQSAVICLLVFILNVNGILATVEPEIISSQLEIITYVNHTAKLSCAIQNRHRHHVTWSRIRFVNTTQKLDELLYVDLLKYTPTSRYHVTQLVEKNNIEYWNLEIRQIDLSDQGYYSCVVIGIKPISKVFSITVIETKRNASVSLRSTFDTQRRDKLQNFSSLSSIQISLSTMFLMIILILIV